MTIQSRLRTAAPGAKVFLYQVATDPEGTNWEHFTTAPLSNGGIPTYQGLQYGVYPIQAEGFGWNGKGSPARPRLRISDVEGVATLLALANGDLVGCEVVRIVTFEDYLDGQPGADPNAHFDPDHYVIERKSAHRPGQYIEYELSGATEQANVRVPGRLVLRDVCTHTYRIWTGTGFRYTNATCPYSGTNYWDRKGFPTLDPALDDCGKRFTDCIKRFGDNAELPTRAFPGCDVTQR